jgi:hypothetical protein
VKQGDLEEVRKPLRLTHTFWGGRFNPIIPLGDPELARRLIKTFRVDCLYCVSESPEGSALLNKFEYLLWPTFNKELFIDVGNGQRQAAFLDVFRPVRHLYEEEIKDREKHAVNGTMFRWDPTDPLADVFLATFGAYPPESEIGKDYDKLFMKFLASKEIPLTNGAAVPATAFKNLPHRLLRRSTFLLLTTISDGMSPVSITVMAAVLPTLRTSGTCGQAGFNCTFMTPMRKPAWERWPMVILPS